MQYTSLWYLNKHQYFAQCSVITDHCSDQVEQSACVCVSVRTINFELNDLWITLCLKNVPPLACYNFDTRERILIFFGRNVTDKVSNQKHFTMPPPITSASALPGKAGKHENRIFHSNAVSVHCQNSVSRCLISSDFLTHDSYSRCCMTP